MDFCTGRLPKDELYCSSLPQLSNYPLAEPESKWSWTSAVSQALNEPSIPKLFPILGNDTLGDCTVAGAAHAITVHNGMVGKTVIPSAADVVALYRKLGNNRDNGLPLTTVLRAWSSGILGGQKILADCNVDPNNLKQVKKTIQFLGGAYIGFATTADTLRQFQNKQPWTVTNSREQGGHCVHLTGFDDATQMFELLTWGNIQHASYEWMLKYCDEVHAILTDSVSAFDNSVVEDMKQAMLSVKTS